MKRVIFIFLSAFFMSSVLAQDFRRLPQIPNQRPNIPNLNNIDPGGCLRNGYRCPQGYSCEALFQIVRGQDGRLSYPRAFQALFRCTTADRPCPDNYTQVITQRGEIVCEVVRTRRGEGAPGCQGVPEHIDSTNTVYGAQPYQLRDGRITYVCAQNG